MSGTAQLGWLEKKERLCVLIQMAPSHVTVSISENNTPCLQKGSEKRGKKKVEQNVLSKILFQSGIKQIGNRLKLHDFPIGNLWSEM